VTTISDGVRLGGVSEVAAELGVTRQQVANLRQQPDFPAPVAALSVGDVWDLGVVARWKASGLRKAAGRPSPGSMPVAVGRRFELGPVISDKGGFGIVHSARDLARPAVGWVAVKVLKQAHALDAGTVARFVRELQLMSGMNHQNVMPVTASGTDERVGLWYSMPLALGSLAGDLATGLSDEDIVAVMLDICAGLDYIHRSGVLHRDLKPENVLRTQAGTWAIADFGLSRLVADDGTRLTDTAAGMGSSFYTAPEQWRDAKNVTQAADIYSAGKILQAMLVAGLPVDDHVPPGRRLGPVAQRAFSPEPHHRYQSAAELLAAIKAAAAPALPAGRWETSAERSLRLRQRLAALFDPDAATEIIRWADQVSPLEEPDFALALSALPAQALEVWWGHFDAAGFTRAFKLYADALQGRGFGFQNCDPLADFARRAVDVTGDQLILREAIRGLAALGYNHNRWHVRDVTVGILQSIREDSAAVSALEGLRMAGAQATDWTAGPAVAATLHPILRAGIAQILASTA
jgi:eukaryotic-like serine/threonine-protein kinase